MREPSADTGKRGQREAGPPCQGKTSPGPHPFVPKATSVPAGDNANPHNIELARRKAYTARTFRQPSSAWAN
jgi:hypothetical protein